MMSMQGREVQMQGQVLSSSAQQLAVQPVAPVVETPKEAVVEKTDEAMYNSLFKSIESAGKAVGHAVENMEHSVEAMEHKAAKVLSQVPITAEVATKEISAAATKEITTTAPTEAVKSDDATKKVADAIATTLASPLKSVVESDKGYDALAKRMEEAGKSGSESVALATAVQAAAAVKAATVTAPTVKPTETIAAVVTEEISVKPATPVTISPPVKQASVDVPPPIKPKVVTSAASVAVPPPVKPTVTTSASSGAVSTPVKPVAVNSVTLGTVPPPAKPSGTYMKEVAPAMAAFQSLKAPSVNLPDLKMPNMKLPDFSIPELNLPSVQMPQLTMPKVSLPSLDDVPIPVKVAGVVAAGGAVVAVGLSLSSKETVGSVMPPGTKKKGTTYLEGLTRSTTTAASKAGAPSDYLESLNFASNSKPTSESASARSSYMDNLASKPRTSSDSSTIKTFRFAPQAFDPSAVQKMEPPNTTVRPPTSVATPGEKPSTIRTFNFAPNVAQRMATPSTPTPPSAEVKSSAASEEVKSKPANQLFNFSPQSFDPNQPYGASLGNNGSYGGSSFSSSANTVSKSVDWRTEENGGYTWTDPDTPQKSGPGVSYLDNLNNRPTSGAYNAYLDAMNAGNTVASLEKTWSNSPSESSPQADPNGALPGNVKSFRKINKNGSYVDNL
jgi:hypothetical protein